MIIRIYMKVFMAVALLQGALAFSATYRIERSYPQGGPFIGKTTLLQFSLFQGTSTTPLTAADLQLEHEKLIHLMTVDSGFLEFQHEHPEEVSPGIWHLPIKINTPGNYRFFVQMLPSDEILTKTVLFDDRFVEFPEQVVPSTPVNPEEKLVFTEGDFRIAFKFLNGPPKQNTVAETIFEIEKNGVSIPLNDLDNYLGAKMHIAGISADKKDFAHAHPESNGVVKIYFRQNGYYGVYMQFKYQGIVHTNQFAIVVSPQDD